MGQMLASVTDQGLWALGLLLLGLLLVANEVGFRLGRSQARHVPEKAESRIGVLTTGMLGLLAFTLGLAISIADQRFEARRDLVVVEANAIGTAWLRAGLLPEERAGAALRDLLTEYTRIRIAYTAAEADRAEEAALNAAAGNLQSRMWSVAEAAARRDPNPVTAGVVAALNDTFDAALSQRHAFESRVPPHILWMLLGGSLLAVGAVGFQIGLGPQRHMVLTTLLMLMWTGGMLLVADLNRPRHGDIRVDAAPLVWTLEGFGPVAPR